MNTTTPKRFDRAFAALVAAFFNNTLAKAACTACAIGNIAAAANGVRIVRDGNRLVSDKADVARLLVGAIPQGVHMIAPKAPMQVKTNGISDFNVFDISAWSHLFITMGLLGVSIQAGPEMLLATGLANKEMQDQGRFIIKATGYDIYELMIVEKAFEANTAINSRDYPEHTEAEVKADQYKGLVAATKALCEVEDLDPAEYIKTLEYSLDPDFHAAHVELVEQAYDLATV